MTIIDKIGITGLLLVGLATVGFIVIGLMLVAFHNAKEQEDEHETDVQ